MSEKQAIQNWWAENPMTYGLDHGTTVYCDDKTTVALDFGSKEFYEMADRQFFIWNEPLHNETGPFGKIFPYERYKGCNVLEIGCGLGCMAMLWAQRGAQVTAVDLNPVSVEQTRKRFGLLNLSGCIQPEDANNLSFKDESFDYVYSWGVLHHSPNIERSIKDAMRVLKSAGGFGIMLYNRRSILHWYMTNYVEGFLHYENRFLGPLELASRYGDGHRQEGNPHTWPVTVDEIKEMVRPFSNDVQVKILGTDLDSSFKYLLPGLGMVLPKWIKKVWARRFGWSLWIYGYRS